MWTPIKHILYPKTYIWVTVTIIKETKKAILIEFDSKQAWLPKSWVENTRQESQGSIKIKISEYHWARKFG